MTQFAGLPPTALGHTTEPLLLWVERTPGVGDFEPTPYLMNATVTVGSNDKLPQASVMLMLGAPQGITPVGVNFLRDWQVLDKDNKPVSVETLFAGGRRFQVRTARQFTQEDWCLFEGFAEQINLGWSGSSQEQGRYASVSGISTHAAADRLLGQTINGQWRRSHAAVLDLKDPTKPLNNPASQECVPVTSVPCVFNPDGRANCAIIPLHYAGTTEQLDLVYVFTDPDDPNAIPWTYAKALRYLQWAAVQPPPPMPDKTQLANPYDLAHFSVGPHWQQQWTKYALWHSRRQTGFKPYKPSPGAPGSKTDPGPNLDEIIEPLLELGPTNSPTNALQTLLRPPTGLAVDRMSFCEAFAYVAHAAGMTMVGEHTLSETGKVLSYLRFGIRGDVKREVSDGASLPGTVRQVYLYLSSDRRDQEGGGSSRPAPQLFRDDSVTEGSLSLDLSRRRVGVLLFGDASFYELTPLNNGGTAGAFGLVPGWEPDGDWDVDPNNQSAVNAALAKVGQPAWNAKYAGGQQAIEYAAVGRSWVLNEDGLFPASKYQRQFGFYAEAAMWDPYRFFTRGKIRDLENRGDKGWCVRRRRFLPINAWAKSSEGGRELQLGVVVEVSFDSGSTWWWTEQLGVETQIMDDRCGVVFKDRDLKDIAPPDQATPTNYVRAYIEGKLRVRVTALVESDDALRAWQLPDPADPWKEPWWEFVDRRGKAPRTIRVQPGTLGDPAASGNVLFVAPHSAYVVGEDRNFQEQANAAVGRIQAELRVPRWTGQTTVPWLWRDGFGPSEGYRVGDELVGVITGDVSTAVNIKQGDSQIHPMPRVTAMVYRIGESGEQSTTLQIEGFETNAELLIGRMAPPKERGVRA